jgi:hypothetical protein
LHENEADIESLQRLLDRSYGRAGEHLRSIFTPGTRVAAADLPGLLPGVQVLNLATATASCEPRVAPVDGLFFRGRFHFGSSHSSLRFRNIRSRPQVSAAVTRGETFAVIVHGRAIEIDTAGEGERPFRELLLELYPDWEEWGAGAPYARIEARAMFAYLRPDA